jgi:hypothetical protein
MRNKTLLIATLALGLVALAALFLNREVPKPENDKQPLVETGLLTSLQSFVVKSNGKTATIEKSADGIWTVKEKLGLPADVENRLTPLIRSLQKANNYGLLTANPKRLEKLGLTDSALTLNAPGKSITIEFGKPTEDGLGNSARLQGQTNAIRTDFSGYLEGDAAAWVDFTLLATKGEEVKSVAFTWADGKREFVRPEKGKPFPAKNDESLNELCNSLATLRVADAVAKSDKEAVAAFAKSFQVKLGFFDGTTLTLTFAKLAGKTPAEPGKAFVRLLHSDAKHKVNSYATKVEFVAPSWIMDQIPGSEADFKKSQQPPAEANAAPSLRIPSQGPLISVPAPK